LKNPENVKTGSSCLAYEVINLGTTENPNNFKLGKSISPEEKKSSFKFFKEYQDVFTLSYQDLKTYDTKIIQQTIPHRQDVKPF